MKSRRYNLRLRKRISVYRRTGLASILAFLFLLLSILPFNQPFSNFIEPASAQAAPSVCALPGKDGSGGAPTGVINTYYPGTGTATSGSTSIPVGTPSTGTAIATNDLLLVIQMQDAAIDFSNTDAYGDGVGGDVPALTNGGLQPTNGGSGFTGGTAGNYEYVVATGPVSGGSVPIKGTNNGGLINTYSSAAATGSQGQKTYQVVRVPQYKSASLGSATAGYWNGTASSVTTSGTTIPSGTGGVLAYDVAGDLALTGTIDVSGRGFRGGAGRILGGDSGSPTLLNTDYVMPATRTTNGSKGEGIAGTPRYTIDPGTTFVVDNSIEGYPNGSYGRGSPGNAGGGSTDGRPSNNDENSGGGGGSNGGYGGIGGRSWNSNLPTGGFGGKAFPAATNRLVLGGGGGAGTTNNGTSSPNTNSTGINSSGAAGGGMVLIRTSTVSGSGGVINANGLTGLNAANDSGGGGGAGGSVLVTTLSNNLTGLTVNANGGKGGDAVFDAPHGPGGGGSGGVVVANAGVSINEAGGEPGVTGNPNQNNAALAGNGLSIPVTLGPVPGVSSGAECIPLLTVTKTTSTPTVVNTLSGTVATYKIAVANGANRVTATNVTISDALPSGFTYDSSVTPTVSLTSGTVAATRLTTTNPANGVTTPAFGTFTIPGGAVVQVTFQVKIASTVVNGTYQNPATATYDDITGSSGSTTTANYNSASSTAEDVVVTYGVSVSGKVWHDADTDLTINGSEAGTNTGSSTLTVYAINTTTSKVIDKAAVAADGTYILSNIPANLVGLQLRLSNDATISVGSAPPTSPTIPTGWFHTGENLNGTLDPVIATLGDIALTTTTSNLTNENFGIRQSYVIAAPSVPSTCKASFATFLNTGINASGQPLAVGSNDLNWTAEWIAGPASGPHTPYSTPRPVGVMPAVVTGNLASGAWINELPNAKWISYPFRISPNTSGYHQDANLNGTTMEENDTVRIKYTAKLTLPSNANAISISIPTGVSVDNQFESAKVNGVENITPPSLDAYAYDYRSLQSFNLSQGWQPGVNTIEIVTDSGPDRTGFFLAINATTTQVCPYANVLMVKRITAINGNRTKNPNDNTALNVVVDDTTTTNDNNVNWPNPKTGGISNFLQGVVNAGKVNPGDTIEYTLYFLNADLGVANTFKVCDRITGAQTFLNGAYPSGKDLEIHKGDGTFTTWSSAAVSGLTSANDSGDRAQFFALTSNAPSSCHLDMVTGGATDNGTLTVDVTGTGNTNQPDWGTLLGTTGPGTAGSYGFIRMTTKVNP